MPIPRRAPLNLPFIDGLRGFAILWVIADHVGLFALGGTQWYFPKSYETCMALGQRGVQLFFLVSAFTLFLSYSKRSETERAPRKNFYIRRAFRILPLWWVSLSIYAVLSSRFTLSDLLPNFFMYFGFYRFKPIELNAIQWSVFVEESFYLIFPLLIVFLTDFRRAIALLGITYAIGYTWLRFATLLHLPSSLYFIQRFPLNHGYSFAMGIVLYFIWRDGRFQRALSEDKITARCCFIGAVALMLECFNWDFSRALLAVTAFFLLAMCGRGPIERLCRSWLVREFGKCCYSIYLFHMLVVNYFERVDFVGLLHLTSCPREVALFIVFLPMAAICLAGGMILHRFVERPTIAWGASLIRGLEERRRQPEEPVRVEAA